MSGIASATKIAGQIAALLVTGLALADAVEKVAEKTGLTKKEIRRMWREYGPT